MTEPLNAKDRGTVICPSTLSANQPTAGISEMVKTPTNNTILLKMFFTLTSV
jgi:hypothetical protein